MARKIPLLTATIQATVNGGDGKPPMHGFVCTSPNAWAYPAKDRSGRLDQIEPPDLGKLLTKLTQTTTGAKS